MSFSVQAKYGRMMRAYTKLVSTTTDSGKNVDSAEAVDQAEDFFNQCYHLKDYMLKESSGVDFSDVEAFISSSASLSLAADYCNTFKHAGLSRPPRSGREIKKIVRHYVLLEKTPTGIRNYTRLEMKVDSESVDVAQLAKECVMAWNDYLKSKGIASFLKEV